jgi:hypothetical protein
VGSEIRSSEEWSTDKVRDALKKAAAESGQASANIFFEPSVSAEQLPEAARTAIDKASAKTGTSKPTIERIHRLSRSVSVRGDPDTIAEMARAENVKAILPSEIDDIYPRPIRRGTESD